MHWTCAVSHLAHVSRSVSYTHLCTGGNGAVITNQCESLELAKDFLYFCKMSYDAQVQCYEMLGYAPYRTDAWRCV